MKPDEVGLSEPSWDARQVAQGLAVARVAVGSALFLAPRRSVATWSTDGANTPAAVMAARAAGARDVALDVGVIALLVRTIRWPSNVPSWISAMPKVCARTTSSDPSL